jgi:hypothetical protein
MTKRIIFNLLFLSSLLFSIISYGQNKFSYIIDSTISKTVDENIKVPDFPDSLSSTIKSTVTINDTALPENYGFGNNLPAMIQAYLSHDTIFLTGFLMARKATNGYKIILTSDSYTVEYFAAADEGIFRVNKTDKPSHFINMICQTNKLTLSEKPQFKVGELIEGRIELTTNDYWSVGKKKNTKVKERLTGYFKTNLLQASAEQRELFKQVQ